MARFHRGAKKNTSPAAGSLPGMAERMWRRNRIRLEDGIFFADDTWIPLTMNDEGSMVAGERLALEQILEDNPDGWAEADPAPGCEAVSGTLRAIGGGGAWEGEGFVALLEGGSGKLVWLLHLSSAERFRSMEIRGDVLVAVSEEPPNRLEWTIPLTEPERISAIPGGTS